MMLQQFRDILLQADPQASHYSSAQQPNYTVWAEYGEDSLTANDTITETAVNIQVDRFTKIEYDPIVDAIKMVLGNNDIIFNYLVDYEKDTGYIHHIFDCKGVV